MKRVEGQEDTPDDWKVVSTSIRAYYEITYQLPDGSYYFRGTHSKEPFYTEEK